MQRESASLTQKHVTRTERPGEHPRLTAILSDSRGPTRHNNLRPWIEAKRLGQVERIPDFSSDPGLHGCNGVAARGPCCDSDSGTVVIAGGARRC
jgi:hypothetical protein